MRNDYGLDDFFEDDDLDERAHAFRLRHVLAVVVALGGFSWLAWYAYDVGNTTSGGSELPLIKADVEPIRMEPDDPGGMEIPHRDKTVYEAFSEDGKADVAERILPLPEEPVSREALVAQAEDAAQRTLTEARAEVLEPEPVGKVEKIIGGKASDTDAEETIKAVVEQPAVVVPVAEVATVVDEPASPAAIAVPVDKPKQLAMARAKATAPKPSTKVTIEKASYTKAQPILASTAHRLQLASFTSKELADDGWKKLQSQHGSVLSAYRHTVVKADVPGKGTFYRLQATGFTSEKEARRACDKLSAQGQGCFYVRG